SFKKSIHIHVKCLKEKMYRKEMNKTYTTYDRPSVWSVVFDRTPTSMPIKQRKLPSWLLPYTISASSAFIRMSVNVPLFQTTNVKI
ncbi:mCG113005, isoform CRA_b, partial [Mus musculus]